MVAERKKMRAQIKINIMWMVVGIVIMGGIYVLSYYDVDETVVSESRTFFEFVRTVLK